VPEESDLIVILPGYPPNREAAQGVESPELEGADRDDREHAAALNNLRSLERVVAEIGNPDRHGFELLQRPLSFRVVLEGCAALPRGTTRPGRASRERAVVILEDDRYGSVLRNVRAASGTLDTLPPNRMSLVLKVRP
jgi:hypothetical protein